MRAFATYRKLDLSFPSQTTPAWAPLVDRWYQLDAYAYGLAEAYFALKHLDEAEPNFMVLGSPGASNHTDFLFARGGATSPSKFVHTLPNIRGSTLCQLMGWKGPLLCLQNDPQTQVSALFEGIRLLSPEFPTVWVWSVSGKYRVHWFTLSRKEPKVEHFLLPRDCERSTAIQDAEFRKWLDADQIRLIR